MNNKIKLLILVVLFIVLVFFNILPFGPTYFSFQAKLYGKVYFVRTYGLSSITNDHLALDRGDYWFIRRKTKCDVRPELKLNCKVNGEEVFIEKLTGVIKKKVIEYRSKQTTLPKNNQEQQK